LRSLSHNLLRAEGAAALAPALAANGGLTSLNLSDNQLCGLNRHGRGTYTAEGIAAIADTLRVNGALTVTNLLGNQLDAESAKMLAKVAKHKGISLCGIRRDQTTADFSRKDLEPTDAILLASDLSQAVVTGALTSLDLSNNALCGVAKDPFGAGLSGTYTAEGITAIADALRVNGGLTSIDLSGSKLCGIWTDFYQYGTYTAEGITAIADALRVNGALTSINLRGNQLEDMGWGAIFAAICGNKDSKIMSLDASGENIGLAGGKLIAKALCTSVTGGLTALNLSHNYLKDEGVSAICKAIQSNKETKLASLNFKNNGISPVGANAVAAMVAVTGGLTRIDLSGNQLCGIWTDGHGNQQGAYTAEGITAIADALRVNGALTKIE